MDDSSYTPLKRCNKCCNEYPATTQFFHAQRVNKDGLHGTCKKCRNDSERERCKNQTPISIEIKVCTTCKTPKPASMDFFHRAQRSSDGFQNMCKECRAKHDHERWLQNSEKIKAYTRHYRSTEAGRNQERKYAQEHRKEYVAKSRRYQRNHPEVVSVNNRNRKARKRNAEGKHTAQDIETQYQRQKGKCYYCKKKVKWGEHHVDHTFPLSRATNNGIPINDIAYLVIACPTCNIKKGNRFPWEWPEGGRLL